jgi:hypothetical protein
MKRFSFILVMLAFVLALGLAVVSCGDGDGNNSGGGGGGEVTYSVYGTYYYENNFSLYVTFYSNGTCVATYGSTSDSATYSVSGNRIRISWSGGSEYWTIVNSSTIRDPNGNTYVKF